MAITPELARWRKALRAEVIQRRLALPAAEHAALSARIEAWLTAGFEAVAGLTIGVCWPYQAEFDARPFATRMLERGSRVALPAVVRKATPLEFLEWRPGV